MKASSKEGLARLRTETKTQSKNILITGTHSYIANAFIKYAKAQNKPYQIEKISLRGIDWQHLDLRKFDVVLHCAGIAHNATKSANDDQYFAVNYELTEKMAQVARQAGVNQFIYMSSMIVFGNTSLSGEINQDTPLRPENAYGKSKLAGEDALKKLVNENFKVSIIRSPMVYGPKSKGNYPLLAKFSRWSPIFPQFQNKRSMIYIENLTELLCQVIDYQIEGTIHPQNTAYVSTAEMVRQIAQAHHRKIHLTPLFNGLIGLLMNRPMIQKVFGDRYYSEALSDWAYPSYNIYSFEESIRRTEQI